MTRVGPDLQADIKLQKAQITQLRVAIPPDPKPTKPNAASLKEKLGKLLKKVPTRPDRYGKLADHTRIRRKYLWDAGFFLLFVAIFLVVQLANRDNTHSYLLGQQITQKLVTQNLQEQPPNVQAYQTYVDKTFQTAELVQDWWAFLFGVFYQNAYQPQWYNGKPFADANKISGGWPMYEVKIVGAIRIRQLRVKRQMCDLAPLLEGYVYDCYPPYSTEAETSEDFVMVNPAGGPNQTYSWTLPWRSQSELAGGSHWGEITTYAGSGYVIDLPSDNDTYALAKFQEMWDSKYIDDQTRVVFIDMMIYNANTDLHSWVRLTTEFPAVGGVLTSHDVRTHNIHRYESVGDIVIMVLELVFCVMLLYYMTVEIVEFKREGRAYLLDFWNYLDWFNYLAFVVAIVFRPDAATFVNFEVLAYNLSQETNIFAFNALLIFFRLYKYFFIVPQLRIFIEALANSIQRVVAFLVCFFIMFCGFAMALYISMGRDMRSFSGFGFSMFSLFRATLGDFDFSEYQQGNRVLGPLLFIAYMVLAFFVFVNVFVAILGSAYQVLHNELAGGKRTQSPVEQAVYGYFAETFSKSFDRMRSYKYVISSGDLNGDGRIDDKEFAALKEQAKDVPGMLEILEQADKDGDKQLDPQEVEHLMTSIEAALQAAESEQQAHDENSSDEGSTDGDMTSRSRGARLDSAALNADLVRAISSQSMLGTSANSVVNISMRTLQASVEDRLLQQIMDKLTLLDSVQNRLETIEKRLY